MKKPISAIIIAFALLCVFLCACGKGTDNPNYIEASEIPLRFYSTLGDNTDAAITDAVLSRYTAENSSITLYYTSVTAEEAYKLSLPDSATYRRSSPDIVYAPLYAVGDILGEEYVSIEEIRTYLPSYAKDTAEYTLLRDSSGKAYGVPVRGEGRVLVVNTDLAPDPTDFSAVINELSDTDIYIFADNALDSELFFEYLMTVRTNSLITPDRAEEHWLEGFRLFSSLIREGLFARSDSLPYELFIQNRAAFAVLTESEAASLQGENYRCAAFFGGFSEGLFITRSALSSPLKRQSVLSLAEKLLAESDSYSEGYIPTDSQGVFFSLEQAYTLTPCEEAYGSGCWGEVLQGLTRGDDPGSVLQALMNTNISPSDA